MKKIYKLFMAVAAVVAVGCTTDVTEDLGVNLNGGQTTLTLSLDDTRTQLGTQDASGVYALTWAENDAISVNGSVSNALAEGEANGTTATFTFENGFGSAPYFVAYPATSTNNQVVFAAEQTHTSNTTFGNGAAVMYGYTTDLSSVKLNHLTGVLKIGVVSGTEELTFIKEVRISTVDRKPIAGAFNVDAEGKLTPAEGATEIITYKAASDAGFPVPAGTSTSENPAYIHIAVPAGIYGELYVTLESADGVMYKTVTTDSTKPVNVGTVREFSNNIEFVPTDETETYVITNYYDLLDFQQAINNAQATMDNAEATEDAKAEATATLAKSAVLVNDIEIPTAVQPGYEWAPINAANYTGTITGNGYAIKNLTTPLFVKTAASFKGLHLVVDVEEKSNPNFGAFARQLVANGNAPKVEHCSVSGSITINTNVAPAEANVIRDGATGSFAGIASGVHFEDCVNNATLELKQYSSTVEMWGVMGGFVGLADFANENNPSFSNCKNNGNLTFSDTTGKLVANLGGFVAILDGTGTQISFDNCTNTGNLTVNENTTILGCNIGGFVAHSVVDAGAISGTNRVLLFNNNNTNIGAISNKGNSANKDVCMGGILGYANFATIDINGPIANSGAILLDGDTNKLSIGGIIGKMYKSCNLNIYNNVTNTDTADIEVKGSFKSMSCIGGIIGISENEGDSPSNKTTVHNSTTCNAGNIDISESTCAAQCFVAGFIAYKHNDSSQIGGNAKVINTGALTINEGVTLNHRLYFGGIIGYINGYNFSVKSNETGQLVNTGVLTFAGDSNGRIYFGGLMGDHWRGCAIPSINTGDIILKGSFLSSSSYVRRIGGAYGSATQGYTYKNIQCFCDIKAYTIKQNSEGGYTFTPFPYVGLFTGNVNGDKTISLNNCKFGGHIATNATVEEGKVVPTWAEITETNFYDYIVGKRTNLTEYAGASYLTSENEIVWGNFGI